MHAIFKNESKGFTLIEVVTVLALISLFASVVIVRQRASHTSLPARAQVLKAHLRYAQSRAMNSDIAWGIQFTGNAYRLFNSDDPDTNRPLPGEDGESVDLTTYNVIINSNVIVSFDTWGRPCSDTDGMEPISEEDPTLTLTLNDTDGNSRDITITRNTGYIP